MNNPERDDGKTPSLDGDGAEASHRKDAIRKILLCLVELLKNLAVGSAVAYVAKSHLEIGHIVSVYETIETQLIRLKAVYYLVTRDPSDFAARLSLTTSPVGAVTSAAECVLSALIDFNEDVLDAGIEDSISASGIDQPVASMLDFIESRAIEWVVHVYEHIVSNTTSFGGAGDVHHELNAGSIDTLLDSGEVIVGEKLYVFQKCGKTPAGQAGGGSRPLDAWIVAGVVTTVAASLLQ